MSFFKTRRNYFSSFQYLFTVSKENLGVVESCCQWLWKANPSASIFHLANCINRTAKTNFLLPKLSEAVVYNTNSCGVSADCSRSPSLLPAGILRKQSCVLIMSWLHILLTVRKREIVLPPPFQFCWPISVQAPQKPFSIASLTLSNLLPQPLRNLTMANGQNKHEATGCCLHLGRRGANSFWDQSVDQQFKDPSGRGITKSRTLFTSNTKKWKKKKKKWSCYISI